MAPPSAPTNMPEEDLQQLTELVHQAVSGDEQARN